MAGGLRRWAARQRARFQRGTVSPEKVEAMPSFSAPQLRDLQFTFQGAPDLEVPLTQEQGINIFALRHAMDKGLGFATNSQEAIAYYKGAATEAQIPVAEVTVGPESTTKGLLESIYQQVTHETIEFSSEGTIPYTEFDQAMNQRGQRPEFALVVNYQPPGRNQAESEAVKVFANFVRSETSARNMRAAIYTPDTETIPTEMIRNLEAFNAPNFREVLTATEGKALITVSGGDITQAQRYDAIVRPARDLSFLRDTIEDEGGAVEKVIGRKGGWDIFDKAAAKSNAHGTSWGRLFTAAVSTDAGRLTRADRSSPQHVIHVNVHRSAADTTIAEDDVRESVERVLDVADNMDGIRSVLFPVIGSGASANGYGVGSSESAVTTLNVISEYFKAHPESQITRAGIIIYAPNGREYTPTEAARYLQFSASNLTFPLFGEDGTQVGQAHEPQVEVRETEAIALPTVLIENKPYTPDELIDALAVDSLKGFSSSLLKFVRAEIIDGDSREQVFFIDSLGTEHNVIFNEGLKALTAAGGKYEGKAIESQLIDAGRMTFTPTNSTEPGDFTLRITGSTFKLNEDLDQSRRSRGVEFEQDRQDTVVLVEQLFAARQTDQRQITITTKQAGL